MKCQFIFALWILWLPHEIISRPDPTPVDSAKTQTQSDQSDIGRIGGDGDQARGKGDADVRDALIEQQNDDAGGTVHKRDHKGISQEHLENGTGTKPAATSGDTSEVASKEAEVPLNLSKRLQTPLDAPQGPEKNEHGQGTDKTEKEVPAKSVSAVAAVPKDPPEGSGHETSSSANESEEVAEDSGEESGAENSLQVGDGDESLTNSEEFETWDPRSARKEIHQETLEDPNTKGSVSSPKKFEWNNSLKKPDKKASEVKGPENKTSQNPTRAVSAGKSKWQIVRDHFLVSTDLNRNRRQSDKGYKAEQRTPQQRKPETSKMVTKSTRTSNSSHEELVGNISDLLSTVGQKINSFEDVNKKPHVTKDGQLKRSNPSIGTQSHQILKSQKVDPKNRSLPASPLLHKKLPSRRETERSSILKKEPSKTWGSAKKNLKVGTWLGADPTKDSGTKDYEDFMEQRMRQLDEPEEAKSPILVKQLPKRLETITGDFGTLAHRLGDNIKSVSAVNKDMSSRRGLVPKTPLERPPHTRRSGPQSEEYLEYDNEDEVRTRNDDCNCYDKYGSLNVVRRTAKRVVRVVRNGTNLVYDGMDFSINKSKDLKDAVKSDIVDPTVKMLPLVGPAVGAVVETGDILADSAIIGAQQVVKGGRDLNNGVLSKVEGMLKKDKTCRCIDTREEKTVKN